MVLQFCRRYPYYRVNRAVKIIRSYYSTNNTDNLQSICKCLCIDEVKGKFLQVKYPVIKKLDESKLNSLVHELLDLGYSYDAVVKEPSLCGILPVTLRYRFKVLQESGLQDISTQHLLTYLTIVKQRSVGELKKCGIIPKNVNVENKLASYMTQWPTSLTTLVEGDIEKFTLHSLRIKIIQRYLELMLDLTEDEFSRGIKTYPTIKHRPLQAINETLTILLREILMPSEKIKSNLYLIHADPENLRHIIHEFKSIGGINIKDVLRMHPKLAIKNYKTMLKTQEVLKDFDISLEAQMRCFQLYTLSPETIRERLEKAKHIPEFNTFYKHPRFLKMIHYNKTALKRLMKLYINNKKCLSLNILSGSSAHYEVYEKAPGDRLGKGKDLLFCICQALGKSFSTSNVREMLKKHPFWINIPLVQVKYVHEQLNKEFSPNDIYENCQILLYPWNKIRVLLNMFNSKKKPFLLIDFSNLSKSQKLSLILYLLEKDHYFTGNGVWTEDKQKGAVLENTKDNKVTFVQ